jgi:2-methoxy-6-polyprenyl-1,4-benzoquinol methylase
MTLHRCAWLAQTASSLSTLPSLSSFSAPGTPHSTAGRARRGSSSSSSSSSDHTRSSPSATTHFGFQDVLAADKAGLVRGVFESVAPKYDLMNDLMSATLHRQWKDDLVEMLAPRPGCRHIDVAGGTGDVAFRIFDRIRRRLPPGSAAWQPRASEIVVYDINQAMLEEGRSRALAKGYPSSNSLYGGIDFLNRGSDWDGSSHDDHNHHHHADKSIGQAPTQFDDEAHNERLAHEPVKLAWVQGDAERLDRFPDDSFDSYTIAFGIRNVTDIPQALREAARVLRPGGRLLVLEFSQVQSAGLRELYEAYSFNVIPAIGEMVADDRESYQYLVESIRQFPPQLEFANMLREVGFEHVQHTNFLDGVVAVHSGIQVRAED